MIMIPDPSSFDAYIMNVSGDLRCSQFPRMASRRCRLGTSLDALWQRPVAVLKLFLLTFFR